MRSHPFKFAAMATAATLAWINIAWGAASTPQERAAAVQTVKQLEIDYARKSGADREAMVSDEFVDIHGSGWIYNKDESAELGRNLGGGTRDVIKPVKTGKSQYSVVAFSRDTVGVTEESTTYYEVPDPQEIARRAGTMTDDPSALAKAAAAHPSGPGPGEAPAPNPYRTRTTRLWVKDNGQWKLAFQTATRVGLKVVPGRY